MKEILFNNAADNHEYGKRKRRISRQRQRTHNKRHRTIAKIGYYPSGYYFSNYSDPENSYVVRGSRGRISKCLKK